MTNQVKSSNLLCALDEWITLNEEVLEDLNRCKTNIKLIEDLICSDDENYSLMKFFESYQESTLHWCLFKKTFDDDLYRKCLSYLDKLKSKEADNGAE